MPACQTPIIVALDFPTAEGALALADQLDPAQCRVKVGKELFTSHGRPVIEALHAKGFEVFWISNFMTFLIPQPWPSRLLPSRASGW